MYRSIYVPIYLSIYLSMYLSLCLFIDLSIFLFVCLSVCLSIDLSIYIFACHTLKAEGLIYTTSGIQRQVTYVASSAWNKSMLSFWWPGNLCEMNSHAEQRIL